uniref:Phospholipase/carboxylesterase/thioesterase domain-containing protein n=1 Tax=Schlesneria paludicola TaxID=360056 RepID=A0A7C2NZ53_9PLAN
MRTVAATCGWSMVLLMFAGPGDASPVEADQPEPGSGRFVDRVYTDADGEHKFVVFEPAGYTPTKKWPTIFYLHGASGRGTDGRAQLIVGLGPAVKARAKTLPFLVVFPQNENLRSRLLGGWTDGSNELDRAVRILDEVERTYAVDKGHVILAGVSMGAFGAWSLGAKTPERWKAVIPVSGGGEPEFVPSLARVPVWAFHAADDQLVPPTASTDLVAAINAAGGRAFVSIVPSGGHNIGASVFARDEVFAWMEHPEREPELDIDWSQRVSMANLIGELPFVPGADVSRAVSVRVNRDVLESLSHVLADRVPTDAFNGWKPGRVETTNAGFTSFEVSLSGIHYSGRLERAWITPLSGNVLRVQLGLRQMTMTIPSTHMAGRLLRADAGPMSVFMGYHGPLWLTIDLSPRIVNRLLKLDLVQVHFHIPAHDFSISRPAVNVRGLPFLEDRVADRLVDGFAEKKPEIEQEIRNGVLPLLSQLEQQVADFCNRTVTYSRWPMPLWQPRFRFYPEAVEIDDGGLTLHLGSTVAALAPKSSSIPILAVAADGEPQPAFAADGVDLAVSQRLLSAWGALLSRSEVARFHVLDLQSAGFRALGQREFWDRVLDDQHRIPDGWEDNTEFVLAKPFRVTAPDCEPNPAAPLALCERLRMVLPSLQLQLSVRPPGEAEWREYLLADLSLNQDLRVAIERQGFAERQLTMKIEPVERPRLTTTIRTANGQWQPYEAPLIAEQFHEGWRQSFGEIARTAPLADLKMGTLALRAEACGATATHVVLRTRRPGVRIYNPTELTVEYQVQAHGTPWSELYRLAPGATHEFRPATPLLWQTTASQGGLRYTLPLGLEARVRKTAPAGVELHQLPGPNAVQSAAR